MQEAKAIGIETAAPHTSSKELFTKVEDAVYFARESGLDALAISIGNVHGLYKGDPELDFERLSAIRDAVNLPLVLHGGSGISDDDFRKAISLGICKINFYTGISQAAVAMVHKFIEDHPGSISYPDLTELAMTEIKKCSQGQDGSIWQQGSNALQIRLCVSPALIPVAVLMIPV